MAPPGRADEIITAEVRPDLVREARIHWGVENNIYQLWHRGYVAVKGGAMDCPYTFMQDMVAGTFRLPWEDQVKVTDGTLLRFCGADPHLRAEDRQGGGIIAGFGPPEASAGTLVARPAL